MAQAKFSAGERVSVMRSGGISAPPGAYSVVMPLPRGAGQQQYRVRGDAESFDRIVDENRMEAIAL